jgi:hypothetical protein
MKAIFLPYFEMVGNYCVERVTPNAEDEIRNWFKNKLEEKKYYHNKRLESRSAIIFLLSVLELAVCNCLFAPFVFNSSISGRRCFPVRGWYGSMINALLAQQAI